LKEKHHYPFSEYFKEDFQKRDVMKANMVKGKGITLITVPCWWDGRKERFASNNPPPTIPTLFSKFQYLLSV